MGKRTENDQYSPEEAEGRFMTAVRFALRSPPKPHSEMKLGKRTKPKVRSPGKRKAVKKSGR